LENFNPQTTEITLCILTHPLQVFSDITTSS